MGQLFIEIQHVVLVLMVLLLVLDHLLPLDGHYLMSVLLLISPLNTENVAFLAKAEYDIVELHRKQLAIFEDLEALTSNDVVNRGCSLASV